MHTHPEVGIERAIFHELHDDHGGVHLGNHPEQLDDMIMLELTHDGSLVQEITPHFARRPRLEEEGNRMCLTIRIIMTKYIIMISQRCSKRVFGQIKMFHTTILPLPYLSMAINYSRLLQCTHTYTHTPLFFGNHRQDYPTSISKYGSQTQSL